MLKRLWILVALAIAPIATHAQDFSVTDTLGNEPSMSSGQVGTANAAIGVVPNGAILAGGVMSIIQDAKGNQVGWINGPPGMGGTNLGTLLAVLGAIINNSGTISGPGVSGQVKGFGNMTATTKAGLGTVPSLPDLPNAFTTGVYNPSQNGETEGGGGGGGN